MGRRGGCQALRRLGEDLREERDAFCLDGSGDRVAVAFRVYMSCYTRVSLCSFFKKERKRKKGQVTER